MSPTLNKMPGNAYFCLYFLCIWIFVSRKSIKEDVFYFLYLEKLFIHRLRKMYYLVVCRPHGQIVG